jgi:hypothetical protein
MFERSLIAIVMLGVVPAADALSATRIPSSAMPGRERQQLLGEPFPPPPRIEWQDGRRREIIQVPSQSRPAKRKRNRSRR